jgi:hypothetical protein
VYIFGLFSGDLQDTLGKRASPRPPKSRPFTKSAWEKILCIFFGVAFETSYFILIAVIAVAQRRHPPTTHIYSDFVDDPYIKQCFCFVEFASLCGRYR